MSTKVLVVDDEQSVCDYVRELLEDNGYTVDTVLTGEACVERVKNDRPDVIILDINMPKISGCAVSALLQEDKVTCSIPIIFLTGYIEKGEADYLHNRLAGHLLLSKPFETKDLLAMIKQVTEK